MASLLCTIFILSLQLIAAGVNPETAEADACRIEHVISAESFEHLKKSFKNNNQEVVPSDE